MNTPHRLTLLLLAIAVQAAVTASFAQLDTVPAERPAALPRIHHEAVTTDDGKLAVRGYVIAAQDTGAIEVQIVPADYEYVPPGETATTTTRVLVLFPGGRQVAYNVLERWSGSEMTDAAFRLVSGGGDEVDPAGLVDAVREALATERGGVPSASGTGLDLLLLRLVEGARLLAPNSDGFYRALNAFCESPDRTLSECVRCCDTEKLFGEIAGAGVEVFCGLSAGPMGAFGCNRARRLATRGHDCHDRCNHLTDPGEGEGCVYGTCVGSCRTTCDSDEGPAGGKGRCPDGMSCCVNCLSSGTCGVLEGCD